MEFAQRHSRHLDARALMLRLTLTNAVLIGSLFAAGVYLFSDFSEPDPSSTSSVWQAIGYGLLRPLVGWSWVFCVWVVCGSIAGITHKLFAENSRRADYVARISHAVHFWLHVAGVATATIVCAMALAAQFWLFPRGATGLPIVGFWMFLAMIVPIECGATATSPKVAIIRAALIPWAFVVLFPIHMSERAGGTRKSAILAGASMIAMMTGFVFYLLATEQ